MKTFRKTLILFLLTCFLTACSEEITSEKTSPISPSTAYSTDPITTGWNTEANTAAENHTLVPPDSSDTAPEAQDPTEGEDTIDHLISGSFEGPATLLWSFSTQDKTAGQPCKRAVGESFGPDDFCLLAENDLLILNTADRTVARYTDGNLVQRYPFKMDRPALFQMRVKDGKVYIPDIQKMIRLDLESGEQTDFLLPDVDDFFGYAINDMLIEDEKLVIITELYGNYFLNEEKAVFEKTDLGYSASRKGKNVIIRNHDRTWTLPADETSVQPIGFGEGGELFVYAFDLNRDQKDPLYCTLRKYSADSKLLKASSVPTAKWEHLPFFFARRIENDSVIVICPYKDTVKVYKLLIGQEWIDDSSEPDILANSFRFFTV